MLEGATCGTQRQARCRRRAPRRRGEGFRGEAPWLQFTNLIDAALDLPMQEKNASPEKDGRTLAAGDHGARVSERYEAWLAGAVPRLLERDFRIAADDQSLARPA